MQAGATGVETGLPMKIPVLLGQNQSPGENLGAHRICTNRKIGTTKTVKTFAS
jgi:hypothetical protein